MDNHRTAKRSFKACGRTLKNSFLTSLVSYERHKDWYRKILCDPNCRQARIDFLQAKKIIGRVKSENIASKKAFLNARYQEDYRIYELLKE